MKLVNMNREQLLAHFARVNLRRLRRAAKDLRATAHCSAPVRAAAYDRAERARKLGLPMQAWHLTAALEKQRDHGTLVAACFMQANGWDVEEVRWLLATNAPEVQQLRANLRF